MSASTVVHALPFTGATLDRADVLRADPEQVAMAASSREARLLAAGVGDVALEAGEPRLLRIPADGRLDPSTAVLLGLEGDVPLFGVDLEALDESERGALLAGARRATLREAGMELSQPEGGLAAYLSALLNWHRTHRFCANCGAHHFPRTDPVVIMLVEHEGRILMGSRAGAPEGRYSVLAGFVSPGETPEDAVIREVWEESRIEVRDPRYVAAQPWPFPASLMLGFEARSDGGEPVIGDGELDDVRWFARSDVAAASRGEAWFQLPGEVSIARTLIERWLARSI